MTRRLIKMLTTVAISCMRCSGQGCAYCMGTCPTCGSHTGTCGHGHS
ncbi:hypothetical protein [Streptomyces microflavus]